MYRSIRFPRSLSRGLGLLAVATLICFATARADETRTAKGSTAFSPPVRLTIAGQPIRLEEPGMASPCWADIDGDGQCELLVGQFADGKIKVYDNWDQQEFKESRWLEAAGKVAEIPGVW